ncbi:MAG TPA: cysteine desulfurase CsdA [Elusimicrobia bacterium]|nr:cysteine desulfurase CsdA [Elusimicrobiota bacterium]
MARHLPIHSACGGCSPLKPAFDVEALRREYPVLSGKTEGKSLVYLDSACTALKSGRVAERLAEFYRESAGCGGRRSTHLLSQRTEAVLEEGRRAAAEFLGASSPEEIVFTSGTTEAVNLVARSFPYGEGRREAVVTELEHNSVLLPFHDLAEKGELELRICPAPEGRLDLDAMEKLITDRTALVALTRASNAAGGVTPAEQVCALARRRGACVLVDDAQYLATHREDAQALDADFIAFSAHKLGGPFGVGVLYGKKHLLNRLGRFKSGGGTVRSVEPSGQGLSVAWLDAPARLEAGVPDFGGAAGLAEALKLRVSLPQDALREHVAGLVRRLAGGLAKHPELRVLGRAEDLEQGALVSFAPVHPGFSPADFGLFLNHEDPERFIAVRVGEHCAHLLHRRLGVEASVRVSFGPYSTQEEADLFLDALGAYLREACR